jgi:hypothetical protein
LPEGGFAGFLGAKAGLVQDVTPEILLSKPPRPQPKKIREFFFIFLKTKNNNT